MTLPTVVTVEPSFTYTYTEYTVLASMIDIRWQSNDRPVTGSAAPEDPKKQTANSHPQNSSSLSTGTKAAIGVVVPITVLMILFGMAFFFRRRMKRSRESAQQSYNAARASSQPTPCTENEDKPGNEMSMAQLPQFADQVASPEEGKNEVNPELIEASPLYEADDTSPTEKRKGER